ncbi:acyltransferase [Oesophagostomum dentatum]|uniref:Acyltransferase n=1 Tax=Oesophagostomum dentatum TaxID=61180 RepID=A0A0B1TR14_OESDE|nr:acyltransferase [Oesophagostomum dentatum]
MNAGLLYIVPTTAQWSRPPYIDSDLLHTHRRIDPELWYRHRPSLLLRQLCLREVHMFLPCSVPENRLHLNLHKMSQKRDDIQGLRGWAIALVLLFHFYPAYFPNGYVGVDISLNLMSSRKAIALVSNIREDDPSQAYENMVQQAEDLFTHTWSLSVEMQWYLVVPFVFLLQRLLTNSEKPFFFGLLTLSIYFYFAVDENTAFYNVLARLWQFCSGILSYFSQSNKTESLSYTALETEDLNPADTEEKCEKILFCQPSITL